MAIDKITAGILYSYNYKLKDSEGNVWDITRISSSWIDLMATDGNQYTATYEEIGTTYKILARDLASIDNRMLDEICDKFNIDYDKYCLTVKDFILSLHDLYFTKDATDILRFNQIIELSQYLYSLNFNIGFPENSTTDLI